MNVRPVLGDWEIPNVAAIRSAEARQLVELPVPGRVGSLFQDLETRPARIVVAGSLFGDEGRSTFLESVRQRFQDGEPLTFVADIVTATSVSYVLIEALDVHQTGARAGELAYRLVLTESPPPPPPPDPLGGLDAGLLDQAQGLLDSVTGALDLIDALGDAPNLGDPTEALGAALDGFEAATDDLPTQLADLDGLFAAAAPPDPGALDANTAQASTDLVAAAAAVPSEPDQALGDLPNQIGALASALPEDPAAATAQLRSALDAVAGELSSDLPVEIGGEMSAASGLMTQVLGLVTGSNLGEVAFAQGETRNLEAILLEQLPELSQQFLDVLIEMRDSVLTSDALDQIQAFLTTLTGLQGGLPSDPTELAPVLTETFVGVPSGLFDGLMAVVDPLLADLDGAVGALGGGDIEAQIEGLLGGLSAAIGGVAGVDVTVEASLDASIELLVSLRADLDALTTSLGSALDGLDDHLGGIDLSAADAAFRAAIDALPTLDPLELGIGGLAGVKEQMLEPLDAVTAFLAGSDRETVAAALRLRLDDLAQTLDRAALDSWQQGLLGFFDDLRERVEAIGLERLGESLRTSLESVAARIEGLGTGVADQIVSAVETPLLAVEAQLDGIDLSAIQAAIDQAFAALTTALDSVGLDTLVAQIGSTLDTVQTFVNDLVAQTAGLGNTIEDTVGQLGSVQFDPVTEAVIAEIEGVTETLRNIDPDALSPIARGALTAAVAVLSTLDFEVQVTGALLGRFDQAADLTSGPLGTVAARLDELLAAVTAFDPALLVAPLDAAFAPIRASLDAADPAALTAPLDALLEQAKDGLDALSPAVLSAPLDAAFAPLRNGLEALSPTGLLQPVVDAFAPFDQALRRIDLSAVLDQVGTSLDQLFAEARGELEGHIQGLGLPQPVSDLMTAMLPLIDLLSPSALAEPLTRVVAALDTALASIRPSDLFAPLDDLYQQLVASIQGLAENDLLAAFEAVRQQVVLALGRLDPGDLEATVGGRLLELQLEVPGLDPTALTDRLAASFGQLSSAFDGLDAAAVPATLAGRFDALRDGVAALDPTVALGPLAGRFASVSAQVDASAGLDLSDLSAGFDALRAQVDAMIPDFLRQPLTAEAIGEALQALAPARCGEALDVAIEELVIAFEAHRTRLLEEVTRFEDEHRDLFALFDVSAVTERFDAAYAAILAQLDAFAPATLVAELQALFDQVEAAVLALDPAFLADRLETTFERVKGKLDVFDLGAISQALDAAFANARAAVEALAPAQLLEDAGLVAAFTALQENLASVSAVAVLGTLEDALTALRDELAEELDKTAKAFGQMVAAVPTSLSAGVSL